MKNSPIYLLLIVTGFLLSIIYSSCEPEEKEITRKEKKNFEVIDEAEFTDPPEGYVPIVVSVNHEYILEKPDWKERYSIAIDSVNEIFQKTTDVQYFISKYLTYRSIDFWNAINSDKYYASYEESPVRSIFLMVDRSDHYYKDLLGIPDGGKSIVHLTDDKIEKRFAYFQQEEEYNMLYYNGEVNEIILVFLHEIAHLQGCGYPELYEYEYKDLSGVEPILPDFHLSQIYPNDPMVTANGAQFHQGGTHFNEVNSHFINESLNREIISSTLAGEMGEMECNILVLDELEQPIEGAEVKISCLKNGYCNDCEEAERYGTTLPTETYYTDENGVVSFLFPNIVSGPEREDLYCIIKGIKVYHGEEAQARHILFFDLLHTYYIDKENVHIVKFIF